MHRLAYLAVNWSTVTRHELAAMNRCDRFQAIGVGMLRRSAAARRLYRRSSRDDDVPSSSEIAAL